MARPIPRTDRRKATAIGFAAVLMWSTLATLTAASGQVPPFLLTAIAFAISGTLGLIWLAMTRNWMQLVQPARVWVLGIGGLFGFHFFYFTALRGAPPVEASLIAYLWPLLIVVFSAFLPGERLRWFHVAGAVLGLSGTIVLAGPSIAVDTGSIPGYGAALAAALTWSVYSLLSRRFAATPTGAVAGFCLATAALSALAHGFLEETVWPATASEWLAVVGLGLMPVGAAFYAWDYGVKRGDIQVLGASAYSAPLLSTALLIVAGFALPSWSTAAATVLIAGGAALASREVFLRRGSREAA